MSNQSLYTSVLVNILEFFCTEVSNSVFLSVSEHNYAVA